MAKLSIIVPVYNTEKYIDKCIESLLSQTLDDVQIIIVNDGSTDGSLEIISSFHSMYPEKIIVLNKENGGLSSSRNFAIPYIIGEYIGFVDSDDYIEEDMYEKMYNLAKKDNLDFVECDFYWDFSSKSKVDTGNNYHSKESFFTDGRVMACNKIYKAELIINNQILFPDSLRYEDIEFFYKLVPFIKKSGIINIPLYHYVQRENSIVNNQNEKNGDIFIVLNNILDFYKSIRIL